MKKYTYPKEVIKQRNQRAKDNFRFGGNRMIALSRDGFMCTECGMTNEEHISLYDRELTTHHIDGNGRNTQEKNNNLDNLTTLCLKCHGRLDIKKRWG